jgi:hypothetical protein
VGAACITYERDKKNTEFSSVELKKKCHFDSPGKNGREILR